MGECSGRCGDKLPTPDEPGREQAAGDAIGSEEGNCSDLRQPRFRLADIVGILALISLLPNLLEVLLSICNLQRCSAPSPSASSSAR